MSQMDEGLSLSAADIEAIRAKFRGDKGTLCVEGLRDHLHRHRNEGGKLWLDHSWHHRNREEQLIALDEWKEKRASIIRDLSLTDDPQKYLDRVFEQLRQCLVDMERAVEYVDVTIDEASRIHLPKMAALDVDPDVDRTRDAMYEITAPSMSPSLDGAPFDGEECQPRFRSKRQRGPISPAARSLRPHFFCRSHPGMLAVSTHSW
jgi:hypothetical protein